MTHNQDRCPLCSAASSALLEKIDSSDIERLYRREYGIGLPDLAGITSIDKLQCAECRLIYFNPAPAGSSEFYSALQKFDWYYREDKPEFREAANFTAGTGKVLDIGAGRGVFAKYSGTAGYTGIDTNRPADTAPGTTVLREDIATHSAAHREEYDCVCLFQVLEHISSPGPFIRTALSCLKPGGLFLVSLPAEDSYLGSAINFPLNLPPHHLTRWPDATLEHAAGLFGLKIEKLWKDTLYGTEARFCSRTMYISRLYRLLGIPVKSIDFSLGKKIITLAAETAASAASLWDKPSRRGSHMMAVYRK